MASSTSSIVDSQNERGYKFSPLPQSETEVVLDHDDDNHHEDHQPLSVSVESTGTRPPIINSNYYSHQVYSLSAHTCEMTQDLLGFTMVMMLLFLSLYRHLGSPKEDPIPPIFVLNSMYISNFTTTNGELDATWDAKFTVMNTNVSSIYFRNIDFNIFYKQNPEDALSAASSYPFYLDRGEYVKLHLKFTTNAGTGLDDDQPFVKNQLVEEIGRDRAKYGSLSFGIQMKVQAIYYGETWVSDVVMSPHCEDLMVQFLPDKGSARLVNPNRNFSVPIEWKPFSFF